jgi:hypothetical protein
MARKLFLYNVLGVFAALTCVASVGHGNASLRTQSTSISSDHTKYKANEPSFNIVPEREFSKNQAKTVVKGNHRTHSLSRRHWKKKSKHHDNDADDEDNGYDYEESDDDYDEENDDKSKEYEDNYDDYYDGGKGHDYQSDHDGYTDYDKYNSHDGKEYYHDDEDDGK